MIQKNQVNTALAKPLALTAGILGLLQGLAWGIFSILSVCCHTGAVTIDLLNSTNNDTEYFKHIYAIFLNPNLDTTNSPLEIKPREFFIFMWFYLVFSILWILISGTVIWAMVHNQWHLVKYVLGSWSAITVLISIVDVVLLSLIAIDYKKLNDQMANQLDTNLVTYGIVMTLVARGYLLWVINITLAIVMGAFVYQAIQDENNDTTGPIINGYDTANSNPPWFGTNDNTNNLISSSPKNHQRPYEDNHGFERSQSFFTADITPEMTHENDYVNLYNTPHPTHGDVIQTSFAASNRVATIGKNKGRRSPLNIVPTPVIPPPDYTPPGSPNGLRPVLRSKSKYHNPSQLKTF